MKRLLLIVLYSTLSAAVCVDGDLTVKDEYSKSEYVLTAAVISANEVPETKDGYYFGGTVYRLRSLRILKGHPQETFTVFSENSSGRFPMKANERYLIFVNREHGRLRISNCGNSGLLDASGRALAEALSLQKADHSKLPTT